MLHVHMLQVCIECFADKENNIILGNVSDRYLIRYRQLFFIKNESKFFIDHSRVIYFCVRISNFKILYES